MEAAAAVIAKETTVRTAKGTCYKSWQQLTHGCIRFVHMHAVLSHWNLSQNIHLKIMLWRISIFLTSELLIECRALLKQGFL